MGVFESAELSSPEYKFSYSKDKAKLVRWHKNSILNITHYLLFVYSLDMHMQNKNSFLLYCSILKYQDS